MDCMIRDLSEDGARIALSDTVALPEVIELDIPQRELRRPARVIWRRNGEIGLCFNFADRTPDLTAMTAEDIMARIGMLEAEIALLRARLSSLSEAETEAGDKAGGRLGFVLVFFVVFLPTFSVALPPSLSVRRA
jgi:hypothetical protein